jgi:hypothetical protein
MMKVVLVPQTLVLSGWCDVCRDVACEWRDSMRDAIIGAQLMMQVLAVVLDNGTLITYLDWA